MKTKLIALIVFFGLVTNAQVLTVNDGVVVEDGDEFVFDDLDEEMLITVTNNTSENIFTRIIVESIENNDEGTDLQLCYGGLCYSSIQEGNSYPSTGAVVIAPGRTNNPNDHFVNSSNGDIAQSAVVYTLKFVQVDANAEVIEGSEISFTYHYTGSLGTTDVDDSKSSHLLNNSITADVLSLNTTEKGNVKVYNLNGQNVLSQIVNPNQSVNVSSLNKGYYIAVFESSAGTKTQKFLKK